MSEELENQNHTAEEIPEKRDYEEELLQLLQSNEPPQQLRKDISAYHEKDIAAFIPKLKKDERL